MQHVRLIWIFKYLICCLLSAELRTHTGKVLLKLLPGCWWRALSAHLLSVYIVKIRFKGGALWRSPSPPPSVPFVRSFGHSNGEEEEESVLPFRTKWHHRTAEPTNFTVGFLESSPKVSRSDSFSPARLNCYNSVAADVAAVLRENSDHSTACFNLN